ncbi:MAG: glycosyltransferase [Candidatus Cryptobacteroides sp.]
MLIALHIILIVLFVVPAAYYFIFAVAGRIAARRGNTSQTDACASDDNSIANYSHFCILIPAYKSDGFIMSTVQAALDQDYPKDKYRVLVISDRMTSQTEDLIRKAGAEVLTVHFENSTKAASLCAAAEHLGAGAADYVAILDSDNIVERTFLSRMNNALKGRDVAIQGHRCAKNSDTPIAVADGIFEEVNNLVFREGHCALGISSALIGSGMALPYGWFVENAPGFVTAGEDKEMELKLLKDGIFVEYAREINILDEKTRSIENLQKQRLRWLTSQYYLIGKALKEFPQVKLKAGYADKLIQWAFIPRILLITGLPLIAIITMITGSKFMTVYVATTVLLYAGIVLGIPSWVKMKDLWNICLMIPRMIAATIKNIFAKKLDKDKFIHTDHP